MRVAVIGAGTMGSGIAQACAVAGHQVVVVDTFPGALERAQTGMKASLERLVKREKISAEDAAAALGRVVTSSGYEAAASAEVVIEAVFESVEVKKDVWRRLGEVVADGALLATNTSSLSVTEIAAFSGREPRMVGMHFFNPVPVMALVEVVRGMRTDDAALAEAKEFVLGLGKSPIVCEDKPGFIVNRLLVPYINDAMHALSEGVASAEDIDTAMKLGANMPIGPLALADLVGLDVCLAAGESLLKEFGDPKFRPAPLLRQMIRAGKLGRKSGEGFFTYDK